MKNQKGFTLLELLIGVGIIAVSGLGIAGLSSFVSQSSSQASAVFTVSAFRTNLQSTIENPEAWNKTVANNATGSMACLANHTDCSASANQPQSFNVYDAENNLVYGGSSATAGFNSSGNLCDTYSASSSDCPYRYRLTWKPICPSGAVCDNPMVSVSAVLTLSSAAKIASADGNFNVLRGATSNTVRRACSSIGGDYNSTTKECDRTNFSQSCGDHEMLAGIGANGTPVCTPLFNGTCSGTDLVVGFDVNTGNPICKPSDQLFPVLTAEQQRVRCVFFGKVNGDTWYTPVGEVTRAESCPDPNSQKQIARNFTVEAEMTCKSNKIVPTGRTQETATSTTIGSCDYVACPTGEGIGSISWVPGGNVTEVYNCYGSPDLERHITFNFQSQFMCTQRGIEPTGRVQKVEVSREPCPAVTANYDKDYPIDTDLLKPVGKILFVVDNSNSMASSQATLSSGIASFLDDLHDMNVEVKVVNTTPPDQGWPLAEYSMFNTTERFVTYPDRLPLPDPVPIGTVWAWEILKTLRPDFHYTMGVKSTADEIADFKANVTNAIKKGGTPVGAANDYTSAIQGSSTEAGLANALAVLLDSGPHKFFNLGDIGAIVFLTDDDDSSAHDGAWYSNHTRSDYVYKTLPPISHWWVNALTAGYQYNYTATNDGVTSTGTTGGNAAVPSSIAWNGTAGGPCSQEVEDYLVANNFPGGWAGSWPGTVVPGSCYYWSLGYDEWGSDELNLDCNSTNFTVTTGPNPGFYADIYAWAQANFPQYYAVPNTCRMIVENNRQPVGYVVDYPALGALSYALPIEQQIKIEAEKLFGQKGFYVTNIVNDGSCSFSYGQQTSTKYMDLGNLLEAGHASNYPICSGNYAGALSQLSSGLITAMGNAVVFNLEPGEEIVGVKLVHNGVTTTLDPSQYAITGSRIDFIGITLVTGDTVLVNVKATLTE